jgi:serine/threonine protein kinase
MRDGLDLDGLREVGYGGPSGTIVSAACWEPLAEDEPRSVGPFAIEGRLGAGAMGRVYLGRAASGVAAAIKVVRAELADDQEFRHRFKHEVSAVGRVLGNHTAALVDADTEAPRPWLNRIARDGGASNV